MSVELDQHGQPDPAFNRRANRNKAFEELWGIIQGIVSDQVLCEEEASALELWLRNQGELVSGDPDVQDLFEYAAKIVHQGYLSEEDREDIKCFLDNIVNYRVDQLEQQKSAINRLYGILRGVSSDRHLNDREIRFLRTWLRHNRDVVGINEFPANVLEQRVGDILEDGVITSDERLDLINTIDALVGGSLEDTGAVSGMATRFPLEPVNNLWFEGRMFCFTGAFVYGNRKKCESAVERRGGTVGSSVTKKLDYLVIGTNSSRDWAGTSHGRKIEKAVKYRDKGCELAIIAEENWIQFL